MHVSRSWFLPASKASSSSRADTAASTASSAEPPLLSTSQPILGDFLSTPLYILPHCKGNSVYVFFFWELRGLSPNFHIHVSLSDLNIPRIGPHISSSRKGRVIVEIYNSLTDTWTWKLGLRPRYSLSGNVCFKFSAFCLCSASS